VNLLGLDASATFEISVADWIGTQQEGLPTRPELANLRAAPVLCIYGQGETDSICPSLPAGRVKSEGVGSGHHFGGEYGELANRILEFARTAKPHPMT
jgi:type IV secretory pathway VirJ component